MFKRSQFTLLLKLLSFQKNILCLHSKSMILVIMPTFLKWFMTLKPRILYDLDRQPSKIRNLWKETTKFMKILKRLYWEPPALALLSLLCWWKQYPSREFPRYTFKRYVAIPTISILPEKFQQFPKCGCWSLHTPNPPFPARMPMKCGVI